MDIQPFTVQLKELSDCNCCPHNCHADRIKGKTGYCKSDDSFNVASVCLHRGEEPAISGKNGICNIFFTNCNLQCIYCQNHQISSNRADRYVTRLQPADLVSQVTTLLDRGITHVGFVSPSHFVPQVKIIINVIESMGYKPVWVYNSNGYDKAETLRSLEGIIDVYLPDLKYMDDDLGFRYSGVRGYPVAAAGALKEMFRQKGTALHLGDEDTAQSGIIVRHLVLPGQTENSLKVLRFLAEELSPKIHLSLMAQYYPVKTFREYPDLNRGITAEEYQLVINEMELLGMHKGWVQEFESSEFYRPDFDREHPFER